MPCLEYRCTQCGQTIEVIRKHNDESHQICPKCSTKMMKCISVSSFVLGKGSWFKNGYTDKGD